MRNRAILLGLSLCVVAACGRDDNGKSATPKPAETHRAAAQDEPMTESRYTRDTDREAMAYLDRFDPFFASLTEAFSSLQKRKRSEDAIERKAVCEAIRSQLADAKAWQAANPVPAALSDAEIHEYQNQLSLRMEGDAERTAVFERVARFAGVQGSQGGADALLERLREIERELAC